MQDFFFGDAADHSTIYESIIKAISIGMLTKKDTVKVWEIYFANEDEDLIIECEKDEWKENLNNALSWYTENEMFEECAYVKKMIDKL